MLYIKIVFYIKSTDNILWKFKQLKLESSTRKTVATNQWWLYSQNKSVCEKKCLLLSKTGKKTKTQQQTSHDTDLEYIWIQAVWDSWTGNKYK